MDASALEQSPTPAERTAPAESAVLAETAVPADGVAPALSPRNVGGTGAMVNPVGVDGAIFGWATGIDETARILDAYTAGGGNFVSTADHYSGGRSEIMIGAWLRTVRDRGRVILETRVGRHPDAAGLSKRSILRAIENSLTRLGTDYVDFLSLDGEIGKTPIEDTMETAFRLVAEGKVRFLSTSGSSAETIRSVDRLCEESGAPRFRAVLVEYNLMERQRYEREFQPLAVEMNRGALARLPLANGYLTGRFRSREEIPDSVLYEGAARHIGRRGERVFAALATVAKELGETPTTVALAWVLLKPGIGATLLRARDAEQIDEALCASNVRLARHQVALLDRASES